jgi:orotidine-5'-phosphate decarboxylase
MTPKDKLIVALDVDDAERALALAAELRESVRMFKVGMQLFTAAGPQIVRDIVSRGGKVFLDLKFHDIPNTVSSAGIEATRLGVSIFNIHASGGTEMMKRTAEAVAETASREGIERPQVIAVTLLTSLDTQALNEVGMEVDSTSFITTLARAAADSGLDGVVASPQEIAMIREAVSAKDFIIVTPGIRSSSDTADDQRRTMTAADAVHLGADYIVVGRPILRADDPAEAAARILSEIGARAQQA